MSTASAGTGLDPAIEYHIVNSLGWRSLRPLQRKAVEPVLAGDDCVLLAPTAGGKTEAAVFPLLSRMNTERWQGLSVLYVTPLRALLNNLHPRISSYGAWLGRTVGLWHGDTDASHRRRMLAEPPDVLLTTPESLESMLVSRAVDHRAWFANVRAVVIDELHSFAAGDRGWHLLGVLERIQRLAGRRVQRIGLSATIGNPGRVGRWMQGSSQERMPLRIVSEETGASPSSSSRVADSGETETNSTNPEVTLDYVGSIENAALIVARLYRGQKRLVFVESRSLGEQLAYLLRDQGVTTYVSHSSLSTDERRRSERAFAEARNAVIVATSTLELGVDIGDLDHVIQIDAPPTVSSFLQRLGRTGRRPGIHRNLVFLAVNEEGLLRASALMLLWRRGFIEAVTPPPHPRHLAAQQLLALALQEGAFGASTWRSWWGDLGLMDDGREVLEYLRHRSYLVEDSGLFMIGPEAEKQFGRRHFMELLSSFIADPELRVMSGRREIGYVSPATLSDPGEKGRPQLLVLNGLGWLVKSVDWKGFTVWVEQAHQRGRTRWSSGLATESFELCQAERKVLLGANPAVALSKRVPHILDKIRHEQSARVSSHGLVIEETRDGEFQFWTWGGLRTNCTLLGAIGKRAENVRNEYVALSDTDDLAKFSSLLHRGSPVPILPRQMMEGLKFSAALPEDLAMRTLGERFADPAGARAIAKMPFIRVRRS
jgi:ATP-dependent Lhr-like helicase